MLHLTVPPSPRLYYTTTTEEAESIFKEVDSSIPSLPDNFSELPPDTRAQLLENHLKALETCLAYIQKYIIPKENDSSESIIAIAHSKDGNVVGRVCMNYADSERPSLDVKVLPEMRRNGYGYEMLRSVIAAAFNQFGYDHLEYDVFSFNTASIALIRKLGGTLVRQDLSGELYLIKPPLV